MLFKLPFGTRKLVYYAPLIIILGFTFFRFVVGGFNFSYFIVAGSDFVNQETVHSNTIVNDGQGYDGQFFYRYAHAPLNKPLWI